MLTSNDFKPNAFEQAIIDPLSIHLQQLLHQHGGQITFHDFMQAALYSPGLGYYMNAKPKLGKAGDFTTAPEISPLFGQCVANQLQEIFAQLEQPNIIEFGAGTGCLASTLLTTLEQQNALPNAYYIIELSGHLQQVQHAHLLQHCPHLMDKVQWATELPSTCQGVVIANEVLDAMPVHLFQTTPNQNYEYYVRYQNDAWQWHLDTLSSPRLSEALGTIQQSSPEISQHATYTSEINLYIQPWLASIAECLTKGCILLFDYGFPRREYYHPDRNQGTMMCHYRQHSHSNPLCLLGVQDITAHVDFTAVAEAADHCGLEVQGFNTLAYFLLGAGLHELIDPITQQAADLQAKQAIMQLTSPSEMGELFKVIQLTKNLDLQLSGFKLKDMRFRL